MAITKEKKINLIKEYVKDLQEAKNLVIIRQSGLAVSTDMEVRKDVRNESGKFNVIRKRLFLRALKEAGYPEIDLSQIPGSAVAVYAKWEEYAPLKVINKYIKTFQKDKDSTSSFEFLLWYFDGERKDLNYIDELANIPSREELLSKLVRLFNYPVQSLTSVLNQIAKKKSEEIQEEKSSKETQEEKSSEEIQEEKSSEETQEEAKEEAVSTTDTELAENSKAQTTSE